MPVTNYYTVDGELLGEKTTGGSRTDYLTDALGSVVATVNPSAQVLTTYRYKPYGAQLAKTGAAADPAFRWVGRLGYRQTEKAWSDVYVRARHYDSASARWASRDPVRSPIAQYAYAVSDPCGVVDPTGRSPTFGGSGNGCDSATQDRLKKCCETYAQYLKDHPGVGKDLAACLKRLGFPDTQVAVDAALAYWLRACSKSDTNLCIWCVPKDGTQPPSPWPPDCRNLCASGVGAWTPVPSDDPERPIPPENTHCDPYWTPQRGCAGLRAPNGLPKCNCVVAFCGQRGRAPRPLRTCSLLYHELIHCGGVEGVPGHHRNRNDFVYALECCLCQAMNGANSPDCREYSCKGFAGKTGLSRE